MNVSFEALINQLKKKGLKNVSISEWEIKEDIETGQQYNLIVKETENIKKLIKETETLLLQGYNEAETAIRQFAIIFEEDEICFMRLYSDVLTPKVQKLIKDRTKFSPVFLEKYKNLIDNIDDFTFWELLFLRDDVIEEFYQLFSLARAYLKDNVKGIHDDIQKEEYSENLMLQLLIIWYLQEKGFLNNEKDYLVKIFKNILEYNYSSYHDFLLDLFDVMMSEPTSGSFNEHYLLGKIVVTGTGPFIDGAFQKVQIPNNIFYQEGMTDFLKRVEPNKAVNVPILNLFESRDWTEGNIDEYVLGAIYEKIISAKERKESGAFYTPENITAFICEDVISSFLLDVLKSKHNIHFSSLSELFTNISGGSLGLLFSELKNVKIVDPAVGSAHFLESAIEFLLKLYILTRDRFKELSINQGMEIKVINEKGKLTTLELLDIQDEQRFKLYIKFFIILSKNIYGVDINYSALKVARARLFLTLAKHFDVKKNHFIMFPNVHFNLRDGNSLIGYVHLDSSEFPDTQTGIDLFLKPQEVKVISKKLNLVSKLNSYITKTCQNLNIEFNVNARLAEVNKILNKSEITLKEFKNVLKFKKILTKILIVSLNSSQAVFLNEFLNEITAIFNSKLDVKFASNREFSKDNLTISKTFHWVFEFPEVFIDKEGFDLVIGNPPYFRMTTAPKEEQKILQNLETFKDFHHGQGDIFYDFIIRSFYLLRDDGYLMFIVSRYWLEATYAKYLKKFLKEKVNLLKILDFRELKIFKGVDINNTIIVYKKEKPDENKNNFHVYIYEQKQKMLSWKSNPIDMMTDCGLYSLDNWSHDENWAFLPIKYKDILMKIKVIQDRIKNICVCSQNNYLNKKWREPYIFDDPPRYVPSDYLRNYRKMGDVKKFTVKDNINKYILILHDIKTAIINDSFIRFMRDNALNEKSFKAIPEKSDKNPDKFDELIYVPYRVTRLNFSFVYVSDKTYVDNTYYFGLKNKVPEGYVTSFYYILGVLNSDLMKFYIDAIGKKKDNDLELGAEILKELPIKLKLNDEERELFNEIEKVTKEIIFLENQNEDISPKTKILNELVYNMYQINSKDQKIIKNYFKEVNLLLFDE